MEKDGDSCSAHDTGGGGGEAVGPPELKEELKASPEGSSQIAEGSSPPSGAEGTEKSHGHAGEPSPVEAGAGQGPGEDAKREAENQTHPESSQQKHLPLQQSFSCPANVPR